MQKTHEQLTADLTRQMEEKINRVVEWVETHPQASLTEIEEYLLEVDEEIRTDLVHEVVNHKESRQRVEMPMCGECGQPMQDKGMKRKTVVTRLGAVKVEREYYWCPQCRAGLFPP